MDKKQISNKLNSQSGVTGADVAIAMLVILTAVGVVVMLYMNMTINSRSVERKTGATRIATNIIENMSQLYYDELENAIKVNDVAENNGDINADKIYGTSIPAGYSVNITFQNLYGGANTGFDLVKKAIVKVTYKVNGQPQTVSLNKVFKRERNKFIQCISKWHIKLYATN